MSACQSVRKLFGDFRGWACATVCLSILLMPTAARAQTLWWEAESQETATGEVRDDDASSAGRFVNFTRRREAGRLEHRVQVPAEGSYQLLIRQTWPWRSVRYRFGDGPWHVLLKAPWLDRQVDRANGRAWGWFTDGRFHPLAKATHTLMIQVEPGGTDRVGPWYPDVGWDCLVLTSDGFAPVATRKPGEPIPAAQSRDQARSTAKLAFWSTARTLEKVYQPGTIEQGEFVLPYRLMSPRDPEPGRHYPLVIALPSSGGRGQDNLAQLGAAEPARWLAAETARAQYPCYVLVPQAPDWFSDEPRPGVTREGRPDLSLLLNLTAKLQAEQPIDANRIYLTGQSLGGFGVCHAMERDADRFAAAVMVAGSLPDTGAHFASTPTWIFVGAHDRRKGQAQAMAQSIRAAGGQPILTVITNVGHVAWPEAYATEGFWDWLFDQSRDPS